MLPLVFYDIPSKLPGNYWTPNPVKPRLVLSYKGLPFETVWVEYPDIATKMQEIGASPGKGIDGSDFYTLPVLSDPNTGALYLDKTYPEKPVFPNDSMGLIDAFAGFNFPLLCTSQILNESSAEYFVRTRQEWLGQKFDEFSPEGPTRDAHWAEIEKSYDTIKTWYDGSDGKWLMGDTFSYADIIIASRLHWFQRVFQAEEWKRVCSLHDGKWENLLADVEKECNLAPIE
ncbi:hypothetical protein BU15DRAFT_89683 [Melanogaster broomeanus]|nr:hypothetical protein BU15DRAFT_89683 [Melanogaster broomeanus]